jgi:uncharacterized coiled-coil DUF342 family protein
MEEPEKKIYDDFETKRKEISEFRSKLNELGEQKEKAFSEKSRYSREIKELIHKVKELKGKRNSLTTVVKEDKDKKNTLTEQIDKKIEEVKKLRAEVDDVKKKYKLEGDPFMIKKEMARLERVIETEAISFDKEQKFMKRIKELKRKLDDFSVVSDVWKKIKTLSDEIDKLKDERENYHGQVQDNARKSQHEHEQMIELSRKIDELKVKEDEANKVFMEYKEKFGEANKQLKERLPDLNVLRDELDKHNIKVKKEKQQKERLTIREKREIASRKLKSGEKLSTEDFLALQGQYEEEDGDSDK